MDARDHFLVSVEVALSSHNKIVGHTEPGRPAGLTRHPFGTAFDVDAPNDFPMMVRMIVAQARSVHPDDGPFSLWQSPSGSLDETTFKSMAQWL